MPNIALAVAVRVIFFAASEMGLRNEVEKSCRKINRARKTKQIVNAIFVRNAVNTRCCGCFQRQWSRICPSSANAAARRALSVSHMCLRLRACAVDHRKRFCACNILRKDVVNIYKPGEEKMKQEEMRQKLIDGTIQVVAKDGLGETTTKKVRLASSINEAYIYRCFKNKEDMFAKTFTYLDEELFAQTMEHFDVMSLTDMAFVDRCRTYFFKVWSFLLSGRDKCLAYVQYFYSPYFVKCSAEEHKKRFMPLVDRFREAFKDEADVWMILNHILNVMLDFVVKVHNGQMTRDDNYAEHVFRVIYVSVKQYFVGDSGNEFFE